MFSYLSDKLKNVFYSVRNSGILDEKNIEEALKKVKISLLEADVNYKVVNEFIEKVKSKTLGEKLLKGINPGQQFIKVIHEEIIELLGKDSVPIAKDFYKLTVIMLIGLQGSGKTTFAAKLANLLKEEKNKVLLIAADTYRPAAIEQLEFLANKVQVESFTLRGSNPEKICEAGIKNALHLKMDYAIIDTAGRLQVDKDLVEELMHIKEIVKPQEILMVTDSMLGQEAVSIARTFNESVGIDGVVLTKLDSDTRGGAALSVKYSIGKPIKFISNGEKINDIEIFHPDRIASRILGMGDVVSLVEKTKKLIDEEESKELEKKLKSQKFDLDDFLKQIERMSKLGPVSKILKMIPGIPEIPNSDAINKQLTRTKAIIESMTLKERKNPKLLDFSRKKRIMQGSGTSIREINVLLDQFEQMKKVMKLLGKGVFPNFKDSVFRNR